MSAVVIDVIEKGTIAVPLPFYRGVAGALLDAGVSPMISHSMPFLEMAVGSTARSSRRKCYS